VSGFNPTSAGAGIIVPCSVMFVCVLFYIVKQWGRCVAMLVIMQVACLRCIAYMQCMVNRGELLGFL
jgi:hypothetical protein